MNIRRKKLAAGLVGGIAAMTALTLPGCGKAVTPETLLADMHSNAKEAESVLMYMRLNVDGEIEGEKTSINVDMDMESIKDPEIVSSKGEISMNIAGIDISTYEEMYCEKKGDDYIIYSYMEGDPQWTVETGDSSAMSVADVERMSGAFRKVSSQFELEKNPVYVDQEECFELTGELNGKLFEDLVSSDLTGGWQGLAESVSEPKGKTVPCTIAIYKDTILPARITLDMGEIVSADLGVGEEVEVFMEMTFLKYNTVKEIIIPEEVLDAAETGFEVEDV